MKQKHYVVQMVGKIFVDTTVAVLATTSEDAARIALDGVHDDPEEWLHCTVFVEPPWVDEVNDVEDKPGDWWADQNHLIERPTD